MDPADPTIERWWDGAAWTGATRPIGPVDYLWASTVPAAASSSVAAPAAAGRHASRRIALTATAAASAVVAVLLATGSFLALAPSATRSAGAEAGRPPVVDSSPAGPAATASTGTETVAPSTDAPPSPAATSADDAQGGALAVLATLTVKGRAPMTGYARTTRFGAAWLDVDRNGCDTRDDVLRRDLTGTTGAGCHVTSGVLVDPYTRTEIDFRRGAATSPAVQIDHVVSLGDAWRTGAQMLTQDRRIQLANDPINLLAVDGPTNQQKGDGDAATWLPPTKSFRCAYVARQIGVKKSYGLWVTPAERAAMARVLSGCGVVPVPVSDLVDTGGGGAVERDSEPESSRTSPSPVISDPRYPYCSVAKQHGAHTPYQRGADVEYDWYEDRDGDGLVCE